MTLEEIIKEINKILKKIENNLKSKKKLEDFAINYLSNNQYKGIIDIKLSLIQLQKDKIIHDNELINYENKLKQTNLEKVQKDLIIRNLKNEIDSFKKNNNKNMFKLNNIKNKISFCERYKVRKIIKNNRSFTKKSSKNLMKKYNINEEYEKTILLTDNYSKHLIHRKSNISTKNIPYLKLQKIQEISSNENLNYSFNNNSNKTRNYFSNVEKNNSNIPPQIESSFRLKEKNKIHKKKKLY